MIIYRGSSKEDAIKIKNNGKNISDIEQIISQTFCELFGRRDGDYFVHNSYLRKDMQGKLYKIFSIEDKDEQRHSIFFEIV